MMIQLKVAARARYWKAGRRDYRRRAVMDTVGAEVRASLEPSPSRVVADAELLAEFERRLSDDERAILGLRRQGASWPEIAARLGGDKPDTVRKRFERAVDRVIGEFGLAW